MYEQTLYKIIEPIKKSKLDRFNKYKKWEYGYNEEYDIVIISRTGEIGEVYEIQGLKIALPKAKHVHQRSNKKVDQYWERLEKPKELDRIKTIFDWRD